MFRISDSVDDAIDLWKRLNIQVQKTPTDPEKHQEQQKPPHRETQMLPMQILEKLRRSKQEAHRLEVELERAEKEADASTRLVNEISNILNALILNYEVRRRAALLNLEVDDIG